jgi:hypothetical protein
MGNETPVVNLFDEGQLFIVRRQGNAQTFFWRNSYTHGLGLRPGLMLTLSTRTRGRLTAGALCNADLMWSMDLIQPEQKVGKSGRGE